MKEYLCYNEYTNELCILNLDMKYYDDFTSAYIIVGTFE